MVEAIGLGRRAVGVDLDRLDPGIVDAGDRGGGCRVVAVMADENPVIVIVEAVEGRLEHRRDDRGFVPGGHQDRDEARLVA